MLTHQAYRYELKPNNKQRTLLAKHAGAARFAYNWGLAGLHNASKNTKKHKNQATPPYNTDS